MAATPDPAIWLLDLDVAGHVYRFATEPAEVLDAGGRAFLYDEGLGDPGVSFGSVLGLGDAAVDVVVDSDVDWADLAARGHALDGRPAILRRWIPGTVLERARVFLRGMTDAPQFGARGESLSLSVSRSVRALANTLPAPQAVVDAATWPDAPSPAVGAAYPLVIGCPGGTEDATPVPVVPLPQVVFESLVGTAHSEPFVGTATNTLAHLPFAPSVVVTVNGVETTVFLVSGFQVSIQLPFIVPGDAIQIDYTEPEAFPFASTQSWAVWIGEHAQTIRIRAALASDVAEADESRNHQFDSLGAPVQAALMGYPLLVGGGFGSPDTKYYAGFRDDSTYGGGIVNRRDELLRGAGDVIEWVLLDQYAGAVDNSRLQSVRGYLNRWKIDTYLNAPVNLWDWLTREILPLVPVEMREGERGIYPAIVRFDLTAADTVLHLDASVGSGNVDRASPMALTTPDIANEITVNFRPASETGGKWLDRRILTGRAKARVRPATGVVIELEAFEADRRVLGSQLCAASQARYGVRPLSVDATAIWDAATAILLAEMLASRLAWPRRTARYTGGPELEAVSVGAAVTLTDPELHIEDAVAVVVDVTPDGPQTALDLVLLER